MLQWWVCGLWLSTASSVGGGSGAGGACPPWCVLPGRCLPLSTWFPGQPRLSTGSGALFLGSLPDLLDPWKSLVPTYSRSLLPRAVSPPGEWRGVSGLAAVLKAGGRSSGGGDIGGVGVSAGNGLDDFHVSGRREGGEVAASVVCGQRAALDHQLKHNFHLVGTPPTPRARPRPLPQEAATHSCRRPRPLPQDCPATPRARLRPLPQAAPPTS